MRTYLSLKGLASILRPLRSKDSKIELAAKGVQSQKERNNPPLFKMVSRKWVRLWFNYLFPHRGNLTGTTRCTMWEWERSRHGLRQRSAARGRNIGLTFETRPRTTGCAVPKPPFSSRCCWRSSRLTRSQRERERARESYDKIGYRVAASEQGPRGPAYHPLLGRVLFPHHGSVPSVRL